MSGFYSPAKGPVGAAMRRALEMSAATQGNGPTFLHAKDAGKPVCTRMGYTPLASHTLFVENRFLDGH